MQAEPDPGRQIYLNEPKTRIEDDVLHFANVLIGWIFLPVTIEHGGEFTFN
ncbi:MAG TPA: hypothetical protein VH519_09420 [Hyphomicrobiaceae bacterium]